MYCSYVPVPFMACIIISCIYIDYNGKGIGTGPTRKGSAKWSTQGRWERNQYRADGKGIGTGSMGKGSAQGRWESIGHRVDEKGISTGPMGEGSMQGWCESNYRSESVYPGSYNSNVNGQLHIDTESIDKTCIDKRLISTVIWLMTFIHAGAWANLQIQRYTGLMANR